MIEKYSAHTDKVGFIFEILQDEDNQEYVARISPSTPPFWDQHEMQFGETEEFRNIDKEKLFEMCKVRMEEIGQGKLIITQLEKET